MTRPYQLLNSLTSTTHYILVRTVKLRLLEVKEIFQWGRVTSLPLLELRSLTVMMSTYSLPFAEH